MKSLHLIRASGNDGGRGSVLAGQMAGLTFTSLVIGVDTLPWGEISSVPCVVIAVDGKIYKVHEDRDNGFSVANLTTDWNAAPDTISPVPSLSVELVTKKWNGSAWVVETEEFVEGEKLRVVATIKNPDGTTYTGPGSDSKFRVPIFAGKQDAPAPNGSTVVIPTDEQIAILPLQFTDGVATFDFIPAKPVWFCAVPGKSSKWLKTLVVRAVVVKAAT